MASAKARKAVRVAIALRKAAREAAVKREQAFIEACNRGPTPAEREAAAKREQAFIEACNRPL
jgi:hypothetical protein